MASTLRHPTRAVHTNISCDGCGTKPIEGMRHKCLICNDYDFCEVCILDLSKRNAHGATHPFFAIPTPQDRPQYDTARSEVQTKIAPHEGIRCDVCRECPIVGVRHCCLDCHDVSYDLCTKCMSKPEVRMKHDLKHVFFPIPTPAHLSWYQSAIELRRKSGSDKFTEFMETAAKTTELLSTIVNGPS